MHVLFRGPTLQRLRLAAGLVLFVFVLTHFLNHALGIVGLEAMEAARVWRTALTRSLFGSALLWGAVAVHVGLALLRLAQRRVLRMPPWELVQIATGLAIPFLVAEHIGFTRLATTLTGASDPYVFVLYGLWPGKALMQTVLLLIVWIHACIGLHYWLGLTTWYRTLAPLLLALAVAIPLLSVAGFVAAGKEVALLLSDSADARDMLAQARRPGAADVATLRTIIAVIEWSMAALVGFALAVIAARRLRQLGGPRIDVAYAAGPIVRTPKGPTLLEISRSSGVPHASICGGRARCSTCRVRIDRGGDALTPAGMAEATTLGSIGAPSDVRLACQIRPHAALAVTRLVQPDAGAGLRIATNRDEIKGMERTLAVMFLDVRGFTSLSERRLPYDIVFILNSFFASIGGAIAREGGWIDKYLGDGLMAVFGRETGKRRGCRAALRAARAIDLALDDVNARLSTELAEPLRIGIGIHVGKIVVGRIGHPETATVTVIGRTVNAASRLESLTKEKACQLIVSREVAELAGWSSHGDTYQSVQVRGLDEPLDILTVARARDVPATLPEPAAPPGAPSG
ncbi:MAG: adenylate/guanylate cyclase domain-containing protein [Hyphomicrobiaceae bacterium]